MTAFLPPQTFTQKAIARAAGLDQVAIGEIVTVRPDRILSHDNTAAITRIFQRIGASRVLDPERLVIVIDHAVPAPSTLHATNHAEIRRFVAEQDIPHFYDAGRGISHQVIAEGVDNEAALDMLSAMGCDLVQGFFIIEPLSADAFERWLATTPWSDQLISKLSIARGLSGLDDCHTK